MKPSIPKGTRDFLPEAAAKRNFIFNTLKAVFEKYAFLPVETPAMEKLETLTGKYGEEGDRLIFKILARGEKLQRQLNSANISESSLADEALRYDLTVPFARMVVQYQNEITFPFKRYQIQPVWRADRPQKGRYREFFQCDVDMIGSKSLLNEIELVQIVDEAFTSLNLNETTIKINHRKILKGISQYFGIEDRFEDFVIAIDKLDKVGYQGVLDELINRNVKLNRGEHETIDANSLSFFFDEMAKNPKALEEIFSKLNITEGLEGAKELNFVLNSIKSLGLKSSKVEAAYNLARGLNYYTGCIFEVVHPEFNSSICGGGRYDDLTGIFGLKDVSGVGISFGADRIFDLMDAKSLFPENLTQSAKIMFANFGEKEMMASLQVAQILRDSNIACEVYPEAAKMKKQFKYAEDRKIPFIGLIGENEIANKTISVKNLSSGIQTNVSYAELIHMLKQ